MNVSDIDSIIHLLQSISFWGIAFIVLIILPLYMIGWSAVFKLLNMNTKQSTAFVIIIMISIIVSLTLLKFGIQKDQELIIHATEIKKFIMSTNNDWVTFETLLSNKLIPQDSTYIDDLIERFPESFSYAGDVKNKALQLIDSASLNQLEKNINKLIPIVYSQLSYYLKKDSILEYDYYRENIDNRISFRVLERVISQYPDQFIEIAKIDCKNGQWIGSIKRIK